jgi:hypothetical protein
MASEIKTKGKKIEVIASKNLHRFFKKRCKKLNVSMSQRLRDLIQKDLKAA